MCFFLTEMAFRDASRSRLMIVALLEAAVMCLLANLARPNVRKLRFGKHVVNVRAVDMYKIVKISGKAIDLGTSHSHVVCVVFRLTLLIGEFIFHRYVGFKTLTRRMGFDVCTNSSFLVACGILVPPAIGSGQWT
jgi:hypothetical protein